MGTDQLRLKLVSAPAVEPLDVDADLKKHLRIDHTDEDDYLVGLLAAARTSFEGITRRALITQTWRLSLDCWPDGAEIELPRAPLQSVTSVVYKDSDGTSTTWSSSSYIVDTDSEPGRIVLASGQSWPSVSLYPANPIQITYVAGFGDAADDVPAQMKHAIKLLTAHWYENREPVVIGTIVTTLPLGFESLFWLSRVF